MTLGPVRVMGAGVVMMMCVEEVICNQYCVTRLLLMLNGILQFHV